MFVTVPESWYADASLASIRHISEWEAQVLRPSGVPPMSQSELEYFRERALSEKRLAEESNNQEAARVHLELARGYDERVRKLEGQPAARLVESGEGAA